MYQQNVLQLCLYVINTFLKVKKQINDKKIHESAFLCFYLCKDEQKCQLTFSQFKNVKVYIII